MMLHQQEAKYKQETGTLQLELDLKGDQISDLQAQLAECQAKEKTMGAEIERLKVELQRALEKANGN